MMKYASVPGGKKAVAQIAAVSSVLTLFAVISVEHLLGVGIFPAQEHGATVDALRAAQQDIQELHNRLNEHSVDLHLTKSDLADKHESLKSKHDSLHSQHIQQMKLVKTELKTKASKDELVVVSSGGEFEPEDPEAFTNDLNTATGAQKYDDMYKVYHQQRKDKCDGCRYLSFYKAMWNYKTVFDAGAANCNVMKALVKEGKKVQGIEFNNWVVENFCQSMTEKGLVEVGPLHTTNAPSEQFDLVLCTDVLEHVPMANVDESLETLARLLKPGGHMFLVIASDPSKHENHADRSNVAKSELNTDIKVHETVQPRQWWLDKLSALGLRQDKVASEKFLKHNQIEKDPRYGFTNDKGKVQPINQRHWNRLYFLTKPTS